MIKLVNICKSYQAGSQTIKALDNLNLEIRDGDFLAVVGHSGSGKTTLLNVLACYDDFDSGIYMYDGKNVGSFDSRKKTAFCRHEVGTVFQEYHLLPFLNVYENIMLPSRYSHAKITRNTIDNTLKSLETGDIGNKYPHQLSGGQKQRVAIARTLLRDVRTILADEPTGALDVQNGRKIVGFFRKMNSQGLTVIMVTHDIALARQARRIAVMENGHVVAERDLLPS